MLYSAAMSNSVVLVSFLAAAAALAAPSSLDIASVDTRCIDSNLESGRYITRVG